jgi:hypothetical protein
LGLAIVRRVVDFHGGSISFASSVGAGSEFLLVFPSVASPRPVLPEIGAAPTSNAPVFPIATTRL